MAKALRTPLLAWVAGVHQVWGMREMSEGMDVLDAIEGQVVFQRHGDAEGGHAAVYATRADRYRAEMGRGLLERVELAFYRGVVNELGVRHQEVLKEHRINTSPTTTNGDIAEALERRWEAEEEVSVKKTDETKAELDEAKQVVKRMGLSVTSAMKKARADVSKPIERVVQECVVDMAKKGETKQRSYWRFWSGAGRKSEALKRPADESVSGSTLLDLMPKYFKTENDNIFLNDLSFSELRKRDDTERTIKKLKDEIKTLESQMKEVWGFNLYNTRAHCARVNKDQTMGFEEKVVEGIVGEINGQTKKIDGKCQELPGKSCPEGLYPLHVRQRQTRRAARLFGITFVAYGPISITFPFIGWALAGPSGAALAAVTLATPGPGFIVSAAVASMAAVPWLGECRCVAEPCEYDATLDSCTLSVQPGTSSKYPWLPYTGLKCAPVEVEEGEAPKCALTACAADDFDRKLTTKHGTQVYGKLGAFRDTAGDRGGIYNCLSTDGTVTQNWEVLDKLPDLTKPEGGILDNSIENRALLYQFLGVEQPSTNTSSIAVLA